MKKIQQLVIMGFVLISLAFAGLAEAATATWTNGTETDLASTNVYRAPGACALPGAFALVGNYLKPAASGALPNPTANGTYCHRATAVNTAGVESVFSNLSELNYVTVPPAAPQNLLVK